MRGDFAKQGDIRMHDLAATVPHQAGGMFEKDLRRRAAPTLVGRREMHADIALSNSAEQRVGQSVQSHIGVAMADELLAVRDADTAQHHRITGTESMHVIARRDPDGAGAGAFRLHQPVGDTQILGAGQLAIVLGAFDQGDVEAEPFGHARVVGEVERRVPRRGAVRGEDRIEF